MILLSGEFWWTYLLAILPLDEELVLEHHQVAFTLLVLHELLELRAERVEQVAGTRGDFLVGEETDPLKA